MLIGDLFIFKRLMSVHTDVDGCVGIVLSKPNRHRQYKVQIKHKTLWILRQHMGKLC